MTPPSPLRTGVLTTWEVLAQSIAMLGPTLTPVLIVPLMYGSAGNGSTIAYALGALLLIAVGLNIREFAIRSASAGSLYEYARLAFGVRGSGICGWALLWAYAFVGVAGITGFAVFADALASTVHGTRLDPIALGVCAIVALAFAYRDIRLSTMTLLVLEAGSISLIVALFVAIVHHAHTFTDPVQLRAQGATLSGIALGTTIAIFSLVGFESATSLGEEAHDPLRTIPRAVLLSVVISGAFFVLSAYIEVLGAHGLATPLDKLGTPLDALADVARVPALKIFIDIGAMLSSFSITLAALNAGGRILFDMARTHVFPASLARSHPRFRTPHIALATFLGIVLAVGAAMLAAGISPIDAFNDTAALGSFGFITIYGFVAVGAPLYLRRLGELAPRHVALAALAILLLSIPAVGSVYPAPPPPTNIFPFFFVGYMVVGAGMLLRRRRAK